MIRINRVHHPVAALGPGRRLGIWVQGCSLACRGCLARDTWNPLAGTEVAIADLVRRWAAASDAEGLTGVTVSGGEPFDQLAALVDLLRQLRSVRTPEPTDLLVYSGYELAELEAKAPGALELADAVITGPFDAKRPTRRLWRGSANQVLHPLSPLGRLRYGPFVDAETDRPPMQVTVEADRVFYVGVPRVGDLPRLERALRARGITNGDVTWRP